MAQQDLDRAIALLNDETVRTQIAGGDLSAVADIELTGDELALLADAVDDLPEVTGHNIGDYKGGNKIKIDFVKSTGAPLSTFTVKLSDVIISS